MDNILHIFINLISLALAFPFVVTLLIYLYFRVIREAKLKSFHKSIDYSTGFFLISVYFLETIYTRIPILSISIIVLLIIMSLVIIQQRKKDNEVNVKRALKLTWRVSFLIFASLYLSFSFYGVLRILLH